MQEVSAEEAVLASDASRQMGILTVLVELEELVVRQRRVDLGVERCKIGDLARLQRGHSSH